MPNKFKSIIKDKIEIYKTNLKNFWLHKAAMKAKLVHVDLGFLSHP